MNTVKRRWPDLLIGLLVLLLLGGFATLLLGRGAGNRNAGNQAAPVQEAGQTPATPATQTPTAQTPTTQTPTTQTPTTQTPTTQPGTPAAGTQTGSQAAPIPTIPAATVPDAGTAQPGVNPPVTVAPDQTQPATTTPPAPTATDPTPAAAPRVGGAVAPSATRTPTRNDYRISLGSYASSAAVRDATAGVSRLGYTVYPIDVSSGTVAQVGPFASREAAAQALADIQRALPGALLYPPRNAPVSETGTTAAPSTTPSPVPAAQTPAAQTPAAQTGTFTAPSPATAPSASGPVYLQVGAYNSTAAAQTTVSRVRDLGLEPSVNAPAGKLVTVLVGPFQGQALAAAEAKLQASGINNFRVR